MDAGLKEKEVWDKEREAIFSSHLEAKANNQKEAVALVQQYEETKQGLISAGDIEKALSQLNPILDEMRHDLIKLEMTLVEQLDVSCSEISYLVTLLSRKSIRSLKETTMTW